MRYLTSAALLSTVLLSMAFPAAAVAAVGDGIPVADEGTLGDRWTLVPQTQLMPPYPPAYAGDPEEVCLVVGYLVNEDGHTSDFAVLKSWTSGANARSRVDFWSEFGDLASRAVAQWRYVPRSPDAAQPVYTATTFVFGTPAAIASTRDHCRMQGLAERLVELRYDSHASRLMSRGIYRQLEIDPYVEERLRQQLISQREIDDRIRATNAIRDNNQSQVDEHPYFGH